VGPRAGRGRSGRYEGENLSLMCYLEYSQNWNNKCVNVINEQEEQDRDGWLKWEEIGSNVDRGINYFDLPSGGSK